MSVDRIHWLTGSALAQLRDLPSEMVQCVVTSPPYWGLRDYKASGQLGLERTPDAYVAGMVDVFREVRRVLRADGTCWVNIGDGYNAYNGNRGRSASISAHTDGALPAASRGLVTATAKNKDLLGIPWLLAFALRADGWYLRQSIIWVKAHEFCAGGVGSVMPEAVSDRCVSAYEHIFLLTKSPRYYFDTTAATVQGRIKAGVQGAKGSGKREGNRRGGLTPFADGFSDVRANRGYHTYTGHRRLRNVWCIPTAPFKAAHFATFPPQLPDICLQIGSRPDDWVLDPFCGSGTTLAMAEARNRYALGIDLNPDYPQFLDLNRDRVAAYLRKQAAQSREDTPA